MKQSEKLDLILRVLYQYRHDGQHHAIEAICEIQKIPVEPHNEVRALAHRLQDDGYIKATFTKGATLALLTSHGIEYCEEDSYAYRGHSIITNTYNMTISNSPNANIVSGSSNVNIAINNYGDIKTKIEEIRQAVNNDTEVAATKKQEIKDCIDEVENNIDAGKKPKFSFNALAHLAGSVSEIGLLVIELGRLIFGH